MAEGHEHEARALEASARQFAEKFKSEHGLEIVFDDSAIALFGRARTNRADDHGRALRTPVQGVSIWTESDEEEYWSNKFVLDAAAVQSPDKFLSDLVVKSYYPTVSTGTPS